MEFRDANSRFVNLSQGARPKGGSPFTRLGGNANSMGVHQPWSRGQAKVLESMPQVKGPCQSMRLQEPQIYTPCKSKSVGVHPPNSRGLSKEWDYVTQTGGPSPQVKGLWHGPLTWGDTPPVGVAEFHSLAWPLKLGGWTPTLCRGIGTWSDAPPQFGLAS